MTGVSFQQEEFRERVRKEIQVLNFQEMRRFAWLCAVRALPFLGSQMNFSYWEERERQGYLLSIFRALDAARSATAPARGDVYAGAARAAAVAADAARGDSHAYADRVVTSAVAATVAAADAAPYDAAAHIRAAADAAAAAHAAATTAADAHTAFDAAYATAAYAIARAAHATYAAYVVDVADASYATVAATYAAVAAIRYGVDIAPIILQDIVAVKAGDTAFHHDKGTYRDVLGDFQASLREVDCAYWVDWYEGLFNKGFQLDNDDIEEIDRRLFQVPNAIRKQGAAAVGRYMRSLGDEVELVTEARIIILGEKGAGKTSLARRLMDINAKMPGERESTKDVSVQTWKVPAGPSDKETNIYVWDFPGHSVTHSAHRCFMSERCLYIYVYNGRVEHGNRPEYWLEQIRTHGKGSPVLFLINEKDDHKSEIARNTLKGRYPFIVGYYEADIRDDPKKLREFQQTVINTVRTDSMMIGQIMSADGFRLKERLAKYFKNTDPDTNFISRDTFDEFAHDSGVKPEMINQRFDELRWLGVFLSYEDEEDILDSAPLVLNPDWITNGIYHIIDWGREKKKYVLSPDDALTIFTSAEDRRQYPRDKVAFLLKVMKINKLAYFENRKGGTILVPLLLPIDRPEALPDFPDNDRLTMKFAVDIALPPNITSRLIVDRHKEVDSDEVELELWRRGAVLHYREGDATACVEEYDRSITVRVKGKDKSAYLASLRETLRDIFDEHYRERKPELSYEVFVPDGENVMMSEEVLASMGGRMRMEEVEFMMEHVHRAYETGYKYSGGNTTYYFNGPVNIIRDSVVNFNNLAKEFEEAGLAEAEAFRQLAGAVEEVQGIATKKDPDHVEKAVEEQGLPSKIKGFFGKLSKLGQNAGKIPDGVKKVQDVLRIYNDVAKLIPVLPQVPDFLLTIGRGT